MGTGGMGLGVTRRQMQLPHAVCKGSMSSTCSLQGGKGCEKPFSPWEGESLRRLPAWEKGLRPLLPGREIPEEGISLNKGSGLRKRARALNEACNCSVRYVGSIYSCARSALEKINAFTCL